MSQKRKTKSIGKRKKSVEQTKTRPTPSNTSAGELWIDPDLNRTIAGPGGNRGDHTTPTAKLLELAEIALKKGA
jgi:hypothetical protein